MKFSKCLALLIVTCGAAARGSPIVSLGHYSIAKNSSMTEPITVIDSGSSAVEDIEGMTFTLQIANGTGTMPSISSVAFLSQTVWTGHVSPSNVTAASGGTDPQFQSFTLITDNPGDFINANGVLANVTFNTAGASLGDYTLRLTGTRDPASDSQFTDGFGNRVATTFATGTLTVTAVPEPGALGIMSIATFAMLGTRFRRTSQTLIKSAGTADPRCIWRQLLVRRS